MRESPFSENPKKEERPLIFEILPSFVVDALDLNFQWMMRSNIGPQNEWSFKPKDS